MRLSYSPAAPFFLFLVQWTDCSLAGALGLLRILIYVVYALFILVLLFGNIHQLVTVLGFVCLCCLDIFSIGGP